MASRAAGYVSSLKADRTALLIPTSNADCLTLSLQVRAALPERLGEERDYATAFGKRTFAVGELVQAREPNREASRSVNRDRFTVVGHRDDGRLDLERERDGQRVTWNLTEKPRLEYGWACTSYSATGKTVDDVWGLQAGNRKVAYGDVTRARERVSIAFTGDFGRMMADAQRDSSKTLVRDAVAAQAQPAQQREQSFARAKTIAAGQREQREAAERAIVEAAARAAAVVVAQREAQARAEAVAAAQRAQHEAAERAQQEVAAALALVERQRQREVIEKARRAAQEHAEAQRQAKAARVAQRSPEDVKRGFAAENIGHFYVFDEEVVHGKDGNEYTIAEGWHNVIGKISLDGDTLNKAAVSFSAESDDGTKVRVPREMDLLELAEGVESESVEISEQYQPLFEAAVERAAEAQLQQDYSQVSSIRFALEHSGGMSKRDCPTDESIMKRLPELRERATNERDPWKYESENDTIARIIRDELGRGRSQSRGMGR